MNTPNGEDAFLHEVELDVREELTLAETGQPGSSPNTCTTVTEPPRRGRLTPDEASGLTGAGQTSVELDAG